MENQEYNFGHVRLWWDFPGSPVTKIWAPFAGSLGLIPDQGTRFHMPQLKFPQSVGHSVLFDSLLPHGLQPARLLCPWNFPGKNTGVGCHFLPQGIFLAQGLNPQLLHWQVGSLPLCHLGGPRRTLRGLYRVRASLLFSHQLFTSLPCSSWVCHLEEAGEKWILLAASHARSWRSWEQTHAHFPIQEKPPAEEVSLGPELCHLGGRVTRVKSNSSS